MKTTIRILSFLTLLLAGSAIPGQAQVPGILHYQGRVIRSDTNFHGQAQFKFALMNAEGTTSYWSNDGSSVAGSEPAAGTMLDVDRGLFSISLGDTNLANMATVSPTVFTNDAVYLRVWVDTGTGTDLLTPDQRIHAVGYALRAEGVGPGGITPNMLQDTGGAVDAPYWSRNGNTNLTEDTHFLGTLGNVNLEFRVNNFRVGLFEPNLTATAGSPSITLGHPTNRISNGTWGAIIAGGGLTNEENRITDDFGTIGGGSSNLAGNAAGLWTDAHYATVGGGRENRAGGQYSTVPGGKNNRAEGNYSLAAGRQAHADHDGAFVWADATGSDFVSTSNHQFLVRAANGVGINTNAPTEALDVAGKIRATEGFVLPDGKTMTTISPSVGDGSNLQAVGSLSVVSGGANNLASNSYSTVGGGIDNAASALESFVGGGRENTANARAAVVGGGQANTASGYASFIGGGASNTSTGEFASIVGGEDNVAGGDYSQAGGRRAHALHDGSYVWADSQNTDFTSSGPDQYLIRAQGGLGIGTTNPVAALHVQGGFSNGLAVITPSDPIGERSAELGLAEDPSYTYGMSIKYDGTAGNNRLHIFGKDGLVTYGPHLTVNRNDGLIGMGAENPGADLHIIGRPGIGHLMLAPQTAGTGGDSQFDMTEDDDGTFGMRWVYDGGLNRYSLHGVTNGSPTTPHLTVLRDSGFVGIGTTTPSSTLEVGGTMRAEVVEITGGSDLAEPFDITGKVPPRPGMVVSIDPDRPGELKLADQPYDRTVAGIISGANNVNTGLILRQKDSVADGKWPVALSGRVYCLVDASEHPIRPGDMLTTSPRTGMAMKAIDPDRARGAVIGKAMTSIESGRGMVLVLVGLQ